MKNITYLTMKACLINESHIYAHIIMKQYWNNSFIDRQSFVFIGNTMINAAHIGRCSKEPNHTVDTTLTKTVNEIIITIFLKY